MYGFLETERFQLSTIIPYSINPGTLVMHSSVRLCGLGWGTTKKPGPQVQLKP